MKKIFIILVLSFLNGSVLNVGQEEDYSTIQSAVDAASNGDIIRIAPGTYLENLLVEKDLTFTSHYMDQNENFGTDYETYRDNTIIDGSNALSSDIKGSCFLLRPLQSSNSINTQIYALTIQHGKGTTTQQNISADANPVYVDKKYGAGIFIYKGNNITIKYNKFKNNGMHSTINAGGGLFISGDEGIEFDDRIYLNEFIRNYIKIDL